MTMLPKRWFVSLLVIVPFTIQTAVAANWFVSPTGTSNNTGTISSPWNIDAVVHNTVGVTHPIKPGDTVWLRAGTYKANSGSTNYVGAFMFQSTYGNLGFLQGTPTQSITLRNYNGERVILDGWVYLCATNICLWGLEITD